MNSSHFRSFHPVSDLMDPPASFLTSSSSTSTALRRSRITSVCKSGRRGGPGMLHMSRRLYLRMEFGSAPYLTSMRASPRPHSSQLGSGEHPITHSSAKYASPSARSRWGGGTEQSSTICARSAGWNARAPCGAALCMWRSTRIHTGARCSGLLRV